MSTLPRSKSLGGADHPHSVVKKKERGRPSSLCEAAYTRITPVGNYLQQLQRTPSQANSLSTTVPTSLVNRPLGGRHTPTRNSLRHSRMVVMSRNSKNTHPQRWSNEVGRVGSLVISSQILVGAAGLTLAMWFLFWAPSLKFRDVPHYASTPVFVSGIFGAIFLSCRLKLKKRVFRVVKTIIIGICCIGIVSCISTCVFTILHLIRLAPMKCYLEQDIPPPPGRFMFPYHNQRQKLILQAGSGDYIGELETIDDEDFWQRELFLTPNKTKPVCICELDNFEETLTTTYPGLSCIDVKNTLPILFVGSCFVMFVGAVLSVVIIYILWTIKQNRTSKSSEMHPFIFRSKYATTNFKNYNFRNSSLFR